MKNIKNWDSLVWIIVWISILSFSLLWIISILNYNRNITEIYSDSINEYILKWNSENLVKKLDNSDVEKDETFYIYKDTSNNEFFILTWALNSNYKYINNLWNKINISENNWNTFTREFTKKFDILKNITYPEEISNLIFRYDATNIDWNNNSTISNSGSISTWIDLIWTENAFQTSNPAKPIFINDWIEWTWWILFDWVDDFLKLDFNTLINNDNNCTTQNTYTGKSFALVIKTWLDVISDQVIYEQWWEENWYNFMIHDWDLYAWIHNIETVSWWYSCFTDSSHEWDSWHLFKSLNLWEILPDSTYFITIVQDSTHKNETWNQTVDDSNNKLQIFLNGILVSETNHVDPQSEHHLAWFWAVNEWNVRPRAPYTTIKTWDWEWWCDTQCLYYKWYIWEFIWWNHALTKNEVKWIQNYFAFKWLSWEWNVIYNIFDIDIKKFIP